MIIQYTNSMPVISVTKPRAVAELFGAVNKNTQHNYSSNCENRERLNHETRIIDVIITSDTCRAISDLIAVVCLCLFENG